MLLLLLGDPVLSICISSSQGQQIRMCNLPTSMQTRLLLYTSILQAATCKLARCATTEGYLDTWAGSLEQQEQGGWRAAGGGLNMNNFGYNEGNSVSGSGSRGKGKGNTAVYGHACTLGFLSVWFVFCSAALHVWLSLAKGIAHSHLPSFVTSTAVVYRLDFHG